MSEEVEAPETPEPEPPIADPHPVDALVDLWMHECIHNSPVSAQTEVYNHLQGAVAELKRRLKGA